MANIGKAERELHQRLTRSFGNDLYGIVSYGRQWDASEQRESLGVVVDETLVSDSQSASLPSSIAGVKVKVLKTGPIAID
jgi:hypothetical protein